MEKKTKAAKDKQEDVALTRALIWFAAAMVLEFLLLLVNRYYVDFSADAGAIELALALEKVFKVLAVAGTAAGIVCAVLCRKRAGQQGAVSFPLLTASVVLLFVGLGSMVILRFWSAGVHALSVVVPALAVLALIYYLYQKEFFLSALAVSVGMFALWMVRQNIAAHRALFALYAVLAAAVLAVIVTVTVTARKNGGSIEVAGKKIPLLSKKGDGYTLTLASCALSLLTGAAGVIFGATAAFYLLITLAAWAFILLVYYTVKLM